MKSQSCFEEYVCVWVCVIVAAYMYTLFLPAAVVFKDECAFMGNMHVQKIR